MYGSRPGASSFANNCLIARRLVEKEVRFVPLFERIKGRRLSERFLNSMQMAGLAAILLLVVYVNFQDIIKLIR